jgi:putative transposase
VARPARHGRHGHVYQGRFKSFPITADEHLLSVLRYVEQNPVRAELVSRAENWRWGSLYRRTQGTADERALLTESPVPLGRLWTQRVNRSQSEAELTALRRCVTRGQPFGDDAWQRKVARQHGLEHTFRPRGRPRKYPPASMEDAAGK